MKTESKSYTKKQFAGDCALASSVESNFGKLAARDLWKTIKYRVRAHLTEAQFTEYIGIPGLCAGLEIGLWAAHFRAQGLSFFAA